MLFSTLLPKTANNSQIRRYYRLGTFVLIQHFQTAQLRSNNIAKPKM